MMADDIVKQVARFAQSCVREQPVLVLGSGASAPYGLRGMGALADHLLETVNTDADEREAWDRICSDLKNDVGLEDALLRTPAPATLVTKIVARTWEAIAHDDLKLLYAASRREVALALTKTIEGMFRSTQTVISVVTTNYDRVAEYSIDLAGFMHETGFAPGLIRSRQGGTAIPYDQGKPVRRVRIWKVHGSLDWLVDAANVPICLPISSCMPEGFSPLIVTPGTSKYERTHEEPFRSAIQGADAAISSAKAIVSVGYGFRDKHIQPKIIERCRNDGVPIVVLARTLTDEAHEFLRSGVKNWLALEQCATGTRAYSAHCPDGADLDSPKLWSLDGFNGLVF
ncbi:SIR2 family protein [Ensifer sp. ENS04]|uniref:SIR2 family protein n=1 Tax=Ensifer sp. ENS04 TaxID=2769281 RepID=UPI00177C9586|nr:SIR2 family protein [Ensifer sp. ENS04]MBD9544773.1 SIR2 family protein [Ensifer sp. ENS04]